ncbi:hypothetical protein CHRYSEOSP005_21430 [Chryseobacterium sp. Alg-005]|uniref:hypothetical protein n=1 Tax=Chryseobacterium sp. Alg-005 TaxID=3159516 RepID=UPI0035557008
MKPFLRIEKPCEESLEKMHDVPGGKFCDLCSKKVLDLYNLSDSEIINILHQKRGEKLCGMVFKNQLNRPLMDTQQTRAHYFRKMTFSKIAAGAALAMTVVNSYPAQTKNINKTELISSTTKASKENQKKEDVAGDGSVIISGKVLVGKKGNSSENTTVSLITKTKVYSTKTDSKGLYTLEVPKEVIQKENLIEFHPEHYTVDTKLEIFRQEELLKKHTTKLTENDYGSVYGEISIGPPNATEKSLVLLGGKKLDSKTFNKSLYMFYNRYDVHYIPKPYTKLFTTDETITDIYIAFVKPR